MKLIILGILFSIYSHGQPTVSYTSKLGETYFNLVQDKYYFEYEKSKEKEIKNYIKEFVSITEGKGIGKIQSIEKQQHLFTKIFPILSYADGTEQVVTNQLLIKLQKGIDINDITAKWKTEKIEKNQFEPNLYQIQLEERDITTILNFISNLNKNEIKIEYAEPNFIYFVIPSTQDPSYDEQWALKNTGQNQGTIGIDVNAEEAWRYATGQGIKVAVIDDGVELNHPDLIQNLLPGYDAFGITNGGCNPTDSHGTACAGIIAAQANNNIGIAGVAYNAKIIPIRIAYEYYNTSVQKNQWYIEEIGIINGINNAWQLGADILSNSWMLGSETATVENAINNALTYGRQGKGSIVLFATGNDSQNTIRYPAKYSKTMAIGSLYRNGNRAPSSNYGTGLNVVAPGGSIYTTNINHSYKFFSGTSAACPNAAGVAALVLSMNPNLSGLEAQNIIERTTQKVRPDLYSYLEYSDKTNGTWNKEVGYGLVDAGKAVKIVKKMIDQDLYIRISPYDYGQEPRHFTSYTSLSDSPDIWNRRMIDNDTIHQTIRSTSFYSNYINIRITNGGSKPSTVRDSVSLHWSKGGTAQEWEMFWDGNLTYNNIPLGGLINKQSIPILQPGESTIVKIPWINVPNPSSYGPFFEDSNSFSLLARIVSEEDWMTVPEEKDLFTNILNNNNIALKNTTILGISIIKPQPVNDVLLVSNPDSVTKEFNLLLNVDTQDDRKTMSQEATIIAELDPILYQAWVKGGKKGHAIKESTIKNQLIITDSNATLEHLVLTANQIGAVKLHFDFSYQKEISKIPYLYHVTQQETKTKKNIGAFNLLIEKETQPRFTANAGEDQQVNKNDKVILQANDIAEAVSYNWYDESRNLIAQEKSFQISAFLIPQTYTLEVISALDGYKSTDQVTISMHPNTLTMLYPNPANNQCTIKYTINSATKAHITLIPIYRGTLSNGVSYPLDISKNQITLDTSQYMSGMYKIMLYTDGKLLDSQNLIISNP
ncbi:S8 family serine peptidase [Myroides odoratus]|uniref:S8 family serine peptidase n=1 Tax=Myroides odoratus TaxID=256 RepID=UPI003340B825